MYFVDADQYWDDAGDVSYPDNYCRVSVSSSGSHGSIWQDFIYQTERETKVSIYFRPTWISGGDWTKIEIWVRVYFDDLSSDTVVHFYERGDDDGEWRSIYHTFPKQSGKDVDHIFVWILWGSPEGAGEAIVDFDWVKAWYTLPMDP